MAQHLTDSLVPNKRDMIEHEVVAHENSLKQKEYTVYFHYEDGCIRSFNGREWKIFMPSRAVANQQHTI